VANMVEIHKQDDYAIVAFQDASAIEKLFNECRGVLSINNGKHYLSIQV